MSELKDSIEFELTDAELKTLLEASRPTPVMSFDGINNMCGTPQENANAAWRRLGNVRGFDDKTVKPITGKGARFFTAVPNA